MSYVLKANKIGKCYVTYRSNILRFASWFGVKSDPLSEYWANRNISFEIKRGEALALIGQNGAGKSTLLKMVTGTIRPTTGSIHIEGKINAILELGLGFNPEFTGRENVFLAGGLMGYSHDELTNLMPEIESFAEIGEFFEKPVRVYSSGMQARLAFALATAKRPDILIVDEVLSVGDSYFQHKSFEKIRQFKEQGTAIILVTHTLGDVRVLCDRVILLDKGTAVKDGLPDEVIDYYNAMIAEKEAHSLRIEQTRDETGWLKTRSGTFEARIINLQLVDEKTGDLVKTVSVGQKLILRLVAEIGSQIEKLVLGFMLRDRTGHVVWGSNTWHTRQVLYDLKQGEKVYFELRFTCDLGPGSYSFSPALVSSDTHLEQNYDWLDNALVFNVVNFDKTFFIGTSSLAAEFRTHRTPGNPPQK